MNEIHELTGDINTYKQVFVCIIWIIGDLITAEDFDHKSKDPTVKRINGSKQEPNGKVREQEIGDVNQSTTHDTSDGGVIKDIV